MLPHSCEGSISLLRNQENLNRLQPYLRRNIRHSLQCLAMATNPSLRPQGAQPGEIEDRPAKRRRINSDGRPSTLAPSNFYGSRVLGSEKRPGFIDRIETSRPPDFHKALRIDLLGIFPKGKGDGFEYFFQPHTIDIKCSVSIFWACTENTESGSFSQDDYKQVCQSNILGEMEVRLEENGDVTRKIVLPRPFVFSSKEFFVNRRRNLSRRPNKDGPYDDYDLADGYGLQITIERVGGQKNWPPFPLGDNIPSKNVQLDGSSVVLVRPDRQQRMMPLTISHKSIPYVLNAHIKWSHPHSSFLPRSQNPSTISHLARHPLKDIRLEPNNAHEDRAGELRARRGRVVDTYNLKTLSAQAQGKSPRKRKARESMEVEAEAEASSDITITYSFGRAENGSQQQETFSGLTCPFCNRNHSSLNHLRFHLHNDHDNFKFHLRRSNPSGSVISYFVELVKPRSGIDGRTFQLGRPTRPFKLDQYLGGDNEWIKSREGPLHNHWPDHLISDKDSKSTRTKSSDTTSREHSSLLSSVHSSRHSSPDTSSRSVDDMMDMDTVSKTLSELQLPKRKTLFVPKTAKPLYHTITKRLLQPGEELPSSDDEKDESWFHQKHRDIIDDFEDVDAGEKEYLSKWNPFAMNAQTVLTSTILDFVENYKSWLAKPARLQKFTVHMGILILQGVVTEKLVSKCVRIIRESEANEGGEDTDMNSDQGNEAEEARHRGLSDCVCLEHVPLFDRVVCVGVNCQGRFFHKACALKLGVPSAVRGKWKCNTCLEATAGSLLAYS